MYDIKVSVNSIFDYLGEKRDFNEYENNKLIRRAVEREFEIIGEAMNRNLKLDKHPEITSAKRIVNLRNYVIHGCDSVDNVIIWGVTSKDLPLLKIEIEELLDEIIT